MQVVTRAGAQSRHVTQRCHNSLRWWNGWQSAGDVTHRKRAEVLGRIERKSRELKLDAEWGGSTFGARSTRWGPDGEASIKRLCLSPYVETFNSKVIKRFRTWTKKSLRAFEFRDSWFYVMYICYQHSMSILHMAVSSVNCEYVIIAIFSYYSI